MNTKKVKVYEPDGWGSVDALATIIAMIFQHTQWKRLGGEDQPVFVRQICDAWDRLCRVRQTEWLSESTGRVMCQLDEEDGSMGVYVLIGHLYPKEIREDE